MRHANKQFRTFEVSGGNSAVESLTRQIKVCETPVCNSDFSLLVVNQHIARLDVSMNNSFGVSEVQPYQHL